MTSYSRLLINRLEGFLTYYRTGFLSALLADLIIVRWPSSNKKMINSLISDWSTQKFGSHHFLCSLTCQTWGSVAHVGRIQTFLAYRGICGVGPRYHQVGCEERSSSALQIVHLNLPNVFSSDCNFRRYSESELFDSKCQTWTWLQQRQTQFSSSASILTAYQITSSRPDFVWLDSWSCLRCWHDSSEEGDFLLAP